MQTGQREQAVALLNSMLATISRLQRPVRDTLRITAAHWLAQADEWEQAIEIAHTIEGEQPRLKCHADIVGMFIEEKELPKLQSMLRDDILVEGGKPPKISAVLLDELISIALTLPQAAHRSLLKKFVLKVWQMDAWSRAFDITHAITDEQLRADTQTELLEAFANSSSLPDIPAALRDEFIAISRALPQGVYDTLLQKFAPKLGQMDEWSNALDSTRAIIDKQLRANTQRELLEIFVEASLRNYADWSSARAQQTGASGSVLCDDLLDIVRASEPPLQQIETLCVIGVAFARAQRPELARLRLEQAAAIIQALTDTTQSMTALRMIAQAMEQAGYSDKARIYFDQMSSLARGIVDTYDRLVSLSEVVQAIAQIGRWDHARQLAQSILDPVLRAGALSGLVQALVHAGQPDMAHNCCDEALSTARSIFDPTLRDWALTAIIPAVALAQPAKMFEFCTEVLGNKEGDGPTTLVSILARALALAGHTVPARLFCDKILASTNNNAQIITDVDDNTGIKLSSETLGAVAEALAYIREWDRAADVITTIERTDDRAGAISALVLSMAKAGEWDRALMTAFKIETVAQRAVVLRSLADILLGESERAKLLRLVQLSWAQATTRQEILHILPPAGGFVSEQPTLGVEFAEGFDWVGDFMKK